MMKFKKKRKIYHCSPFLADTAHIYINTKLTLFTGACSHRCKVSPEAQKQLPCVCTGSILTYIILVKHSL